MIFISFFCGNKFGASKVAKWL